MIIIRIWLHLSYTELKSQPSKQEKRKRCGTRWTVAKRERGARARSSGETCERGTRKAPLTNLWPASPGIFDHAFGKPLTWNVDKFTYTFDPLLTARKGVSKEHLWYGIHRRSQVSKNGFYRLWSGWQRRIQRWSLMRVKSHQIRAKVAFTKPLTTHLMRGEGDFSRRDLTGNDRGADIYKDTLRCNLT